MYANSQYSPESGSSIREVPQDKHELDEYNNDCERVLGYLFGQPELRVVSVQPGKDLRTSISMEQQRWVEIAQGLIKRDKVVVTSKTNPALRHNDTLALDLNRIIELSEDDGRPGYLNPAVVARAKELTESSKEDWGQVPVIVPEMGAIALTDQRTPILAEPTT